MSKKKVFHCSICGTPAPANPKRAGWDKQGHRNLVCPDCLAERRLNAKNRGRHHGSFARQTEYPRFNDSISAAACQEDFADSFAIAEAEFAAGRHRVRFV